MPESPPKRVTRARARATTDTRTTKKPTIITTPAAKATRVTKRKTRADEEEEPPVIEAPPPPVNKLEPEKATRGRSKKAASQKQEPVEDAKDGNDEPEPIVEAPKARGRPKKVPVSVSKPASAAKKEEVAPTRKITRARAPAALSVGVAAKVPVFKKKVTFQEEPEQGKENVMPLLRNAKKSVASAEKGTVVEKPTGLKAKPVRKPAATRAAKRGKEAATEVISQEPKKPMIAPLSPKKAVQVAVASIASSDEDELCGAKTPTKVLSKSPVKVPGSAAPGTARKSSNPELSTSIDEIQLPSETAVAPTKTFTPSILASPARRPAQTPFKDGFKESPKKSLFGESFFQQALKAPTSPSKDSLRESPKRINLGESLLRSHSKLSKSPLKASLLQSPARRAAQTPQCVTRPKSPAKSGIVVPVTDPATVSAQISKFTMPTFSPQESIQCPFQASKSPERSVKVHRMTPKEQQEQAHHDWMKSPFPLSLGFGSTPATVKKDILSEPIQIEATPTSSPRPSRLPTKTPSISHPSPPAPQNAPVALPSPSTQRPNHAEQSATKGSRIHSTSPTGLPSPKFGIVSAIRSPFTQRSPVGSTSEDELQSNIRSYTPKTLGRYGISTDDFGCHATPTPTQGDVTPTLGLSAGQDQEDLHETAVRGLGLTPGADGVDMMPLALQFGSWQVASPDKKTLERRQQQSRGIFSPAMIRQMPVFGNGLTSTIKPSPIKTNFFEDEMSIREQVTIRGADDPMEDELASLPPTEASDADEHYGDENAMPIDSSLLAIDTKVHASTATCTPAKVFSNTPQVVHTVSKIPLKPAAEETPSRLPVQRRQSASGPPATCMDFNSVSVDNSRNAVPRTHGKALLCPRMSSDLITKSLSTPTKSANASIGTPSAGDWSFAATPASTRRRETQTLKGAVVYVDVHTTEGADASGIFIELLNQMGARCVKQWAWNPNTTTTNNDGDSENTSTPSAKIGITHVVFKDGGKRTLEKVRRSNGVVLCVGVGWVLDCERDNKWLDEAEYAVDTSLIPRGGHRRRKSMEPRALSNINGSLFPTGSSTPRQPLTADLSPTKEFLTFDTPTCRRDSFLIQRPTSQSTMAPQTPPTQSQTPLTDTTENLDTPTNGGGESSWDSPTTPYYLSKGASLIQQTCPPKQSGKLLFPLTGEINDQPDEGVRQRLVLARRKSLQWAPKVGSPLSRGVSFGL
ncbi:MAG: hypothetical protein M1836_000894 [Candelina mexicana]|nr:MAG: hypothetical protein M1836_000894 [Candelina mexicana]